MADLIHLEAVQRGHHQELGRPQVCANLNRRHSRRRSCSDHDSGRRQFEPRAK